MTTPPPLPELCGCSGVCENGTLFGRLFDFEGDQTLRMGAYVLHLRLTGPILLRIRTLGAHELPDGSYLYVGSARRGIAQRCARHDRLARQKSGKIHWHVDHLLADPRCVLEGIDTLPGAMECNVSRRMARRKGISVPVPGFGSSDCRSGCRAHLYRIADASA